MGFEGAIDIDNLEGSEVGEEVQELGATEGGDQEGVHIGQV